MTPTSGTATIAGRRYADLTRPLQTVGAALEASSFHPGRTAANHLKVYAQAAGLPSSRVEEVLGLVGLADVAGRKVGGFSLGMRQRLSLAYTLLGDPGVLVLDEPANGLDPEGIKWLRGFLRELAREGRTVLVSSHMLAEVQQTVSSLLIISHGRLVYQGDMAGLTQESDYATVIDSPDRAALGAALDAAGIAYEPLRTGFTVRSTDPAQLGALAASAGVALSNLQRKGPALEEVFLDLVNGVRVHASVGTVAADGAGDAPAVDAAVVDAEAVDATPDVAEQDAPATDAVAPAVAEPEPAPEAEPETQPEQPAEEAVAFFARYTSETDAADAAGEAAAAGTSEEPPSADDPPSPAGEAAPPSEPGDAAEGGEQR